MNNRLKELIFDKLYRKLRNAEIIPYKDSIWFIDRENEYWYFEFDTSGTLWWRYHFFTSFFEMFSMTRNEFAPILSDWVEEVLNHKVTTTNLHTTPVPGKVEEVLNHKVSTTQLERAILSKQVEEVLNHKVSTTALQKALLELEVEEVLNHKVSTTEIVNNYDWFKVEEVLNHKVCTTDVEMSVMNYAMEQVLNHKVTETQTGNAPPLSFVKDVLNNNN